MVKRFFTVGSLLFVLILSACVPDTVSQGGIVVRGEPAPARSVDYAALAEQEGLVFVTPSGKKYHKPGCSYVIVPPIAITPVQAEQEGYTPCSRCFAEP